MKDAFLNIKDLHVEYTSGGQVVKAVNGVDITLNKGETLGLVGETGAGKTTIAKAILRILPQPPAKIRSGEIWLEDQNLLAIPEKDMLKIRGGKIAMIFQDPMTALNPVFKVGDQIAENIMQHEKVSKKEAKARALELLTQMGIPEPEKRIDQYPHEFSGGMRQRAVIALAMSCNPKVLLADEPTTALDVTIQAQIFELMDMLKEKFNTAIMLITHDMGVVSELADDVLVMYMGNVIESGTAREVLKNPKHPYTKALMDSIPVLGLGKEQNLTPIRGSTPDPFNRPKGCQFCPRCDFATAKCEEEMPGEVLVEGSHKCRCFLYQEQEGGK